MDKKSKADQLKKGKKAYRGRGRGEKNTSSEVPKNSAVLTTSEEAVPSTSAEVVSQATAAEVPAAVQSAATVEKETETLDVVPSEEGKLSEESLLASEPTEVEPLLIKSEPIEEPLVEESVEPESVGLESSEPEVVSQETDVEVTQAKPIESTMSSQSPPINNASKSPQQIPVVLELPNRKTSTVEFEPQGGENPQFLTTTPTFTDGELDRGQSVSYPKSESGSVSVGGGRPRRLSGIRGDDRARKISIGLGGVPKKGYWGGMDDSSDSDDSLLAQTTSSKRRKSVSFVLGPKLMGYNRRQWLILIVIAVVDFCSAVLISIQAPIYPGTAIAKGVTATQYGILFGSFELTIFLMSPVFYNLLRKIDMKIMFNFGIFTTGISAILFSFLDHIDEQSLFLLCSFILRICEGIGDAAILTAAYAIVTLEFPDTVANTFTSLEAFLGIGFIVGPPLAGLLEIANGFMLPFLLFGVLLIASGILSLTILPKLMEDNRSSDQLQKPAFLSLLQIPSVALAGFSILTSTISLGFINSTLYAHLSQFMLSPPAIGAIFILNHGLYSLSAPVWNVLINRISEPKYILTFATLLIFTAFLFVGPAAFIPFDTSLEGTCVSLAVAGIALGGILISGFIVIMKDTVEFGFPDNEATFGMSSGLYASIFTFGSFIGLSISGVIFDNFGFRWACLFPLGLQALLALVTVFYILIGRKMSHHRSRHSSAAFQESDPLLLPSAELAKSYQQQPPTSAVPKKMLGSSYGTSTSYESIG